MRNFFECHLTKNCSKMAGIYLRAFFPRNDGHGRGVANVGILCNPGFVASSCSVLMVVATSGPWCIGQRLQLPPAVNIFQEYKQHVPHETEDRVIVLAQYVQVARCFNHCTYLSAVKEDFEEKNEDRNILALNTRLCVFLYYVCYVSFVDILKYSQSG